MIQKRVCLATGWDLRPEFLEMAGMLVDLNVVLAHYNQSILLDKWIFRDEPSAEQRLDAWKEKLQECDACVMMFWKGISPSTEQELKLALECAGQEGFLKRVIVFFKSTEQDEEQVRSFREHFTQTYHKHFYVFTSVDELKYQCVNIYLNSVEDVLDKHMLVQHFRGRMSLNGNPMADLFQVPCYGKNPVFMKLAQEALDLKRDIRLLSPETLEYVEKSDRLAGLYMRLDGMVECIWNLSLLYIRVLMKEPDRILVKVLQLFNQGQFEKADERLSLEGLENNAEQILNGEIDPQYARGLLDGYEAKLEMVECMQRPGWEEQTCQLYERMQQLAGLGCEKPNEEVSDYLYREAKFLLTHTENYVLALKKAQACLSTRQKLLHARHVKVAQAMNVVGVAQECTGNYDEAREFYLRSYELCAMPGSQGQPWDISYATAVVSANLANLMAREDSHRYYLQYELTALQKLEEACGKFSPMVGHMYENVGLMYLNLGVTDCAYDYLKESVRIRERLYVGMPTGDLAGAYDAYAQVCSLKGVNDQALVYFRKALETTRAIYGEYHVNTTHCYTDLGVELQRQGLYAEAEEQFLKVVEILNIIQDEEDLLEAYHQLSKLYQKMGAPEKADEMKEKIKDLKSKMN